MSCLESSVCLLRHVGENSRHFYWFNIKSEIQTHTFISGTQPREGLLTISGFAAKAHASAIYHEPRGHCCCRCCCRRRYRPPMFGRLSTLYCTAPICYRVVSLFCVCTKLLHGRNYRYIIYVNANVFIRFWPRLTHATCTGRGAVAIPG